MFYYLFLALAYKHGEISVVYPIARGTGVGLTSIIAYFFLEEDISVLGWIGIWLIVFGVMCIGLDKQIQALLDLLPEKYHCKRLQFKFERFPWKEPKYSFQLESPKDSKPETETFSEGEKPKGDLSKASGLKHNSLNESTNVNSVAVESTKKEERNSKRQAVTSLALAIAVGICITSYSVTDKKGVMNIDPVTYITFIFAQTGTQTLDL